MKKIYILLLFLITLTISAQAPQGFNYQATVRNNAGALMINKNVTFKFNVMKDTQTSVPIFSETHYVPTDDLGAVNLVIGKGTATSGTFATIDWATGTYYLGIELNTGNGFVAMGTSQLLSVPYALYATKSGNGTSIGDISTSSNPKGATITSGALSLTPADANNGGILTTGSQTIAGTKTFSSDVTVNGITVGKGAGQINSNIAIGIDAIKSNTTGEFNIGIGIESIKSNSDGKYNVGVGSKTLKNNTTGISNTAIGDVSLQNNSTGNYNTAIGDSTLFDNTTGTENSASGYAALWKNTVGIQNTATGNVALRNNTIGNKNSAFGFYSLRNNTNGNLNVAVGHTALATNTTGNNNSAFGSNADVVSENLTNATAIGYNAKVSSSNTIQLGNTNVTDVKTAGTITARSFVGDGSQLTNIANNQPWLISSARDTLSFAKQVIIGDKNSVNVPPLTVIGTDSGPTSSTLVLSRSKLRNNVLGFETSETDNNFLASIGLIESFGNTSNFFGMGIYNGIDWKNPFRIYYNNGSIKLGMHSIAGYSDGNFGGVNSISIGYDAKASGNYSVTLGTNVLASGLNSTAVGMNSKAIGPGALVFGVNSDANGTNSTAIGFNSKSIGDGSTAIGLNSTAAGAFSFSAGVDVNAYSFAETAMGRFNTAYSPLGQSNGWSPQDRIFVIGNGESDTVRKDALTILKNGNTTINGQLSVNSHTITNVSNPVNAQDAATKAYVDALVAKITALETRLNNLSPLVTNQEYLYVPGAYTSTSGYGSEWSPSTSPKLASTVNENFEGYIYFSAPSLFSFTTEPQWGQNTHYGQGSTSGTISLYSNNNINLSMSTAEYYKINVNMAHLTYTAIATSWGILGSATTVGWGSVNDLPMNYNPTTKKWSITTNLTTGQFKFRANNEWNIAYGDNGSNGSLEYNATDIDILAAGNYTIILDLSNPSSYTYSIIKNN
jgi:trimeric autotransporter adhesin